MSTGCDPQKERHLCTEQVIQNEDGWTFPRTSTSNPSQDGFFELINKLDIGNATQKTPTRDTTNWSNQDKSTIFRQQKYFYEYPCKISLKEYQSVLWEKESDHYAKVRLLISSTQTVQDRYSKLPKNALWMIPGQSQWGGQMNITIRLTKFEF